MFIECSNLIVQAPDSRPAGMAVADIDGDGRDEIIVASHAGPNRVLKWVDGALVDLDLPELADPQGAAVAVACGDLDGDGREEIYVVNSDTYGGPKTQPDRLYAGFGDRWIDLFSLSENWEAVARHAGRSVAVIDREGEGRYAFFVTGYGGPQRLYEMGPRGRVIDRADLLGLDVVASARAVIAAPLTGDALDLFVGCELGPNLLFRQDGEDEGDFEEVAGALGLADAGTNTAAVALVDGEGRLDIVVAARLGPLKLYTRRPGGGFVNEATDEMAEPATAHGLIVADFDNDGWEEILLLTREGPNRLFARREEGWVEIEAGDITLSGDAAGAVVADLDGDGQVELVVSRTGGGPPLGLFIAEPRGHHWLRVRPLTKAGAPARGAVVTLFAAGRSQMRVIDGGSGYLCQSEPVAHFGLGDARAVERVEVRWPDGCTAFIQNPGTCAELTIPHPETGQPTHPAP